MPTHILLSILMAIVLGAAVLVLGASLAVAIVLAAIGSTAGVLIGRAVPPPEADGEASRRPLTADARRPSVHPEAQRSVSGS